SLIFLFAYGGMVSLAQAGIYGVAGMALGNMVANGGSRGLNLGWSPWLSVVLAILIATGVAFVFGAVASRSTGIYFLMLTLVFSAWFTGIVAPSSSGLNASINILTSGVIGGLLRVEGAWVGAFVFVVINNCLQDVLGSYGDRITTVIGLVFLLVVLISPNGL